MSKIIGCMKCNNEMPTTTSIYMKCSKCGQEYKWDFKLSCWVMIEYLSETDYNYLKNKIYNNEIEHKTEGKQNEY